MALWGGGDKKVEMCNQCWGTGKVTCDWCHGDGWYWESPLFGEPRKVVCKKCDGTGKVECPKCKGEGLVESFSLW